MQDTQSLPPPRVVIIGAGTGGLSLAIKLKQQLGYDNFTIFEKGHDVGGTWRDNTYPGCSSDISMVMYSLSTEKHDWSHSHGTSPSILSYWKDLTTKYNLYPRIQLNTAVTSVTWDDAMKIHRISLENVKTGEKWVSEAEVVVSAIGVLEVPRFAQIQGRENFKGETWHSARWPSDGGERLRGKKVAVIGNGASATQFVPCITEDPAVQVTEFCRTPNFFLPPVRIEYSATRRWIYRNIPFVQRFWRWLMYLRHELFYLLIFGSGIMRYLSTKIATYYIKYVAPKEYHEQLVPKYTMGCKRVIFDTNFLEALHRPNLDLNWDGVDRIIEDGIITQKGEKISFDIIIFATGYAADKFPLKVHGIRGSIQDYFVENNGPQAYLGTTFPGFPNFFTILGPNTATGHTSVIFTNETQADYIIQLITPILTRHVATIEVKPEATEEYNEKIQKRLAGSVFVNCQSWYRVGGTGKITNIFPGATTLFWLWLRKPKWGDYTGLGLEEWLQRRQKNKMWNVVRWCVTLLLLLGAAAAVGVVLQRNGALPRWLERW
ncbi:FAD/NAD(P)-binding domain-containing protein [Macrolepiota fuliginosa MF-IS2]|uniref:FAD/NAD(P)-binding domain-containing protein n=1 Tax=Macrolepiota fuliginosa MF-IS2 TaxID=1400762 RepID=A0A9P5X471_9AGAR|nr:FAD/NAD(P)-binding domain-containing protein [Macrolepiota fuliginosa MF-IS2]